jgi:tRNA-specific 2-thiouridylase
MKNWEEQSSSGRCHSESDWEDVLRVCDKIDIPCYSVNFVQQYRDNVFSHFLAELKAGHTPNPDILCNREIKFKVLLEKALSLGAEYLATGHYCRKGFDSAWQLLKGSDENKDQSYFLCAIAQKALAHALFPIGHLPKGEVRKIAMEEGIPVAEKKDSTGICFIGKRNFKEFVGQYLAYTPGNIVTLAGDVVGKHDGVSYYTIGQRHGLHIGGAGDAWFVAKKNIAENELVVVQGKNHPSLFQKELFATELSWIAACPTLPLRCMAKVRYRQKEQPCSVFVAEQEKVLVVFDEPQRAVTPRQAIVFYQGDICLGGGLIETMR